MRRSESTSSLVLARCSICQKFLHKWNNHEVCIACSLRGGYLCSREIPCSICSSWDPSNWALYLKAVDKIKCQPPPVKRRVLQSPRRLPPQSQMEYFGTPSSIGSPTAGPAGPYGSTGHGPWPPRMDTESLRAHLQRQLAALPPVDVPISHSALTLGLSDLGDISQIDTPQGQLGSYLLTLCL